MTPEEVRAAIEKALSCLVARESVFEIRILAEGSVSSGYYSDIQKAAADIAIRDTDPEVSGIYVTVNPVNPALLARRANRLKFRLGKKDATTSDGDILRRRWLPVDIDPVRPSGVSSSADEHAATFDCARTVREFLESAGWPEPIFADSGNGAHLLYPVDLPEDEIHRDLIRQILDLLHHRFSNPVCRIDTANFNAARIWKVYGTMARKGDHLPDRPHRRSRLINAPDRTRSLTTHDLTALLDREGAIMPGRSGEGSHPLHVPNVSPSDGTAGTGIHLGSWLSGHGLSYAEKPYQGGILYVLDRCPFSDDHTDGAFAIQFKNGAIFAGCHHTSCGGGRQRWQELRERYKPAKPAISDRMRTIRSDRIQARTARDQGEAGSLPDRSPDPGPRHPDETISLRAREILTSGDPFSFFLETFGKNHEGDLTVAECLLHSLISRTVVNSKGLHVSISGESGKGKSHAMETMRSLVPPDLRIEGRVSDKALFYMDDLRPGTVIALDDAVLSDQMQEILKGVTTSFQKPFPYRTVNKDRKSQTCLIPERCVWWISRVEGAGDDQVFNRMLTCWIDDSESQDLKVLSRSLEKATQFPSGSDGESEELLICRQIWEEISPVFVVIPFASRIRFQSAANRRNPDMLLDLIRTHAALNQYQRESRVVEGVRCIIATEADFADAARLYVALNGESGAQTHKLTKRESVLLDALSSAGIDEVPVASLQRMTGWSSSTIHKLLHGYLSYGKSYSGLLEKCPAVSFLDRTVSRGDDGCTTLRRMRVYSWDAALYEGWMKGGSVWLEDNRSDPPDDPPSPPDTPPDSPGEIPHDPGMPSGKPLDRPLRQSAVSGNPSDGPPSGTSLSAIDPRDFIMITGGDGHHSGKHSCSVCGKGRVMYREKRFPGKSRDPPPGRYLCRSCYDRAVSRTVAATVPLPGMLDPGSMVRRTNSVGRCQVCGLHPATWSDPVRQVHVCDACHARAMREDIPDYRPPPNG